MKYALIAISTSFLILSSCIALHCIDSQLQETSAKAVELIGSLTKIAGNQECQEPSAPGAHQDFSQVSRYSGEEWIGQVPSHWQVVRLGALFKMVSDPGNDDLPILSVSIHSGISDREYGEDDLERKVARSEDKSKYQRVMPGDLVYNMMRAWQGAFGTATVEGMVSPSYIVARPLTSINTRYIEEVLRTPRAIEQMRIHSKGITDFRLRLYWDDFKNIKISLPPSDEIESILGRIDDVNAVSIESAKIIALVRERRSAVIASAMAGELSALHALEG